MSDPVYYAGWDAHGGQGRCYFLFITDAIAFSLFPLVFGLTVVAPDVITVMLGAKWHGAIVATEWLAASMALCTLTSLMNQVLTSLRYKAFLLWMPVVAFLVIPVSFAIGSHWGMAAVAAVWVITAPLTMLPKLLHPATQGSWKSHRGDLKEIEPGGRAGYGRCAKRKGRREFETPAAEVYFSSAGWLKVS